MPWDAERGASILRDMRQEATNTDIINYPVWLRDRTWRRVTRTLPLFVDPPERSLKRLLNAKQWVPAALRASKAIEVALEAASESTGIPEIKTDFNRIGVHRMKGTEVHPAVIGRHVDTEREVGVVAVLSIEGQGENSVADSPGILALVACKNLCDVLGIDQYMHGAESHEPRTSYTFAQYGEPT